MLSVLDAPPCRPTGPLRAFFTVTCKVASPPLFASRWKSLSKPVTVNNLL